MAIKLVAVVEEPSQDPGNKKSLRDFDGDDDDDKNNKYNKKTKTWLDNCFLEGIPLRALIAWKQNKTKNTKCFLSFQARKDLEKKKKKKKVTLWRLINSLP